MSKSRKKVSGKTKSVRLADDKHVVMLAGEAKKANPRRETTKAGKRHADMRKYLGKKRGKATVKDVYANTSYKSNDLHYDLDKGFVKVVSAR